MKTLAFLGVAHIHTPDFIQKIARQPAHFRIKSLWDDQPARAAIAAQHAGAVPCSDFHDILRDNEVDAVVVCSETALHRELVLGAAAAGKQLFVEKPLAINADDAFAMQRAIDAAGVLFHIGHFMRGYPYNRQLKSWLEAGKLGRITRARHSNVHHGALAGWFDAGVGWYEDGWRWMTDMQRAGMGGFGDLGAHSLDILLWLLGDVDCVTAQLGDLLGKYPCDEYGEGMLRFASGAIGTIAAGWADQLRPLPLLISGTAGTAYVDDGKLIVKSQLIDGADGNEWTDLPPALPHAFDLFLAALLGEAVPLISAKEAAKRSAVMQAFYQAAASQTWVHPHQM